MAGMAWTCEPYDVARAARLSAELGLAPATAAILVRRGHGDPSDARAFLAAGRRFDPERLSGVPAASELVLRHVRTGSRVAVFGDYDVDGVCSTAVAVRALRAIGADPVWRAVTRAMASRARRSGSSQPPALVCS
jgi:single-stranded-DNA-specific exonuclease